ncbi:MAG: flagellar biosynthesis repressor FlbT [Bacteroidales bacterium]
MPLLIDLKPGEKVIINGAVIENVGANTKIRICNDSTLLRQKEIMSDDDANSPASRVYFCLQNAYIFPEKRPHYMALFEHYLAEFLEACPTAQPIGQEVRDEVAKDHLYRALKTSRKLLTHEVNALENLRRTAEQLNEVLDTIEALEAAQENLGHNK